MGGGEGLDSDAAGNDDGNYIQILSMLFMGYNNINLLFIYISILL